MRKVAVLTYPIKHRKTFDVLSLLKAKGYKDVLVCAIPFSYEKKKFPLISHRPEMNFDIPDLEKMSKNFGYNYIQGDFSNLDIEKDRIVLVAGAGILPNEFIALHKVINAHPGFIPNCRGLDALKWAIYEDEPIGVTTHLLGKYVDGGLVIERRKIDLRKFDTFHALAQRVYENEVSMLVEAIEKCELDTLNMIYPEDYKLHKRMPQETERELFDKFEVYKRKYTIDEEG